MQTNGMAELDAQLHALEALASGRKVIPTPGEPGGGVDFAQALKAALDRVNGSQQSALGLAQRFETGRGEVALHDVMLAMQKANIEFQAVIQVRNRVVAAYQDIMNMQI
jgi:flagellar hook-basal body complex protein FliE